MNDYFGEVLTNKEIAPGVYRLDIIISKPLPHIIPGQFAMLEIPREDCILRRPLGICSAKNNVISFVYQVKGEGTQSLTRLEKGDKMKVLLPLGNGFPNLKANNIALVGGGLGVVPLYAVAEKSDCNLSVYNGFSSKENSILTQDFEKFGRVVLCTDDGSAGYHGYPVNALEDDIKNGYKPDVIFCCGPEPLMKAVKNLGARYEILTYLSLEQKMGCGVGACLTCTCKVAGSNKRVCKDGPVFCSTEVFE